jgi:type IV secretory pathway component VirB8
MDPELSQRLKILEEKVDATYKVAYSARRMFLWTIIITLILTVIPLIALAFVLPTFIHSFDINTLVQ